MVKLKLLQPIYVALPFKPFGARGIMLFPFAFYKPHEGGRFPNPYRYQTKEHLNETTKYHERVHFQQALWMGVIPFYIWYIVEYLFRFCCKLFNHKKAYRSISFEREAYEGSVAHSFSLNYNSFSLVYFSNRPIYNHLNYI